MILLDAEDQQQSKQIPSGPTVRLPEASVAARSSTILPDYETSQAQAQSSPRKSTFRTLRSDSRFWRATLYALAIYVALSVAIGVPLIVTQTRKHKGRPGIAPWEDNVVTGPTMNSAVLALDSDDGICDKWDTIDSSSYILTSYASHSMPYDNSFYIRSNVSDLGPITGNLTVDFNDDPSEKSVVIHVTMTSSSDKIQQESHVCFLDDGDYRGLSIYVPDTLDSDDILSFDIAILFPASPPPVSLCNFVTNLPTFSQIFGNLSSILSFSSVALEGSYEDIVVGSLTADKISVRSSLGSISGTFNATQKLTLDTIEGSIHVNATLVHLPTYEPPTSFHMDTGNSDIQAKLTLLAPPVTTAGRSTPPPSFRGHVKTFNAPILVDISYDPSTSSVPLDLRVQNNQAESNVTLDSKYSGMFDVQTKLASVLVVEGSDDTREYKYDQKTSTRCRGWVGWGAKPLYWEPGFEGRVEVVSSLSPVYLQLASSP